MTDTTRGTQLVASSMALNMLGVAFVVLKLCDKIDWSWWWVTAPFWGPWTVILVLVGLALGAIKLWLAWTNWRAMRVEAQERRVRKMIKKMRGHNPRDLQDPR
jgi:hypothetical protein